MKNLNETPKIETTTPEQQTPLKVSPLRRLTPEQRAASERLMDKTSKAIIQGLHEDNQEIFGKDYDKKAA